MRYYAVIDTNVVVSSALSRRPDSPPKRIMTAIEDRTIIPLCSEYLLREYRTVLQRDKFCFDRGDVDRLVEFMASTGILIEPGNLDYILPDPKDAPIYAISMSVPEYDPYLVTGNIKHFPVSNRVVTPKEMMDIIDAENKRRMPD